ncbi:hypothetical protein NZ698_09235 [Chryseobacterium sp. PBS4-4]|uniref:Lipocalin-like domain-containing protein n=1 Tax=Chryseobacterium edaphi TaxID=2976532 RepID=A0ABT2W5A8_9FLAO|nr:hypothetical protein [Chryseobacterium edaphi]MCU7617380.1 hypothetical protein [Chryseobacterium edaphi]
MKNLFKFVCIIAFLTGGLYFGQTQSEKKPVIKVKYCKKFHVSVGIGIVTVDTDVVGCLVTVDGFPIMLWGRNANNDNQNEEKVEYLYVEEGELMKELNVKDPKDLENMRIIKSGIWDYEGEKYVLDTNSKSEVLEFEGVKYYAFHLQKVE